MPLRGCFAIVLAVFVSACVEQNRDDSADGSPPKSPYTHVVSSESAYYTSGPQQGRPPDGTFKPGTRVELLKDAGSYSLVRSDGGIEAYVATDALIAAGDKHRTRLTPEVQSLAVSNNRFAVSLYRALASQQSGNLFFSPLSISTALAMAYAGAEGRTETEMAEALQFQLPEEALHPAFAALARMLADQRQAGYRLHMANRLWGQEEYGFRPEYLKITDESYGAELAQVDFASAPEAARKQINLWVEQETAGEIENLLPSGAVDEMTRLVLTSAVYFNGRWTEPFQTRLTQNAPFHVTADRQAEVPLMHQTDEFPYAEADGVQILELPYGQNEDLAMAIVLPKEIDGLPQLETGLDAERLQKWLAELRVQQVRVFVPRFRLTSAFELSDVLRELGMVTPFSPTDADFSGMSTREDLFLSAALHKAFVDVNEKGTEAAAATGIGVGAASEAASEPPVFRADRPFLFLIRHRPTGAILFLGRLVDPQTSPSDRR